MELFEHLSLGFGVAFTGQNLIYAFIGCLLGTLIGVLPGIGPLATIAMLLARHLCLASCGGIDHAGRDLLRCPVRWIHHRHSGEPARRVFVGGDRH